jgi:hypothetical protein
MPVQIVQISGRLNGGWRSQRMRVLGWYLCMIDEANGILKVLLNRSLAGFMLTITYLFVILVYIYIHTIQRGHLVSGNRLCREAPPVSSFFYIRRSPIIISLIHSSLCPSKRVCVSLCAEGTSFTASTLPIVILCLSHAALLTYPESALSVNAPSAYILHPIPCHPRHTIIHFSQPPPYPSS